MLPTTNRTIAVQTLTRASGKSTFVTSIASLAVYINQTQEDQIDGYDSQPGFYSHRMFIDGNHAAITIGDRIVDSTMSKTYDVRGKAIHSSIVGTHHQYLLSEATS